MATADPLLDPTTTPEGRARFLAATLPPLWQLNYQVLVAANTSSIARAALLADRTATPMVYVRAKAKAHGKGRQVEGALPARGSAVVVAESTAHAAEVDLATQVVADAGLTLAGVVYADGTVDARTQPAEAPVPPAPRPVEQPADIAEAVAAALLDISAVTVNHAEPYTFASGLRSPIYTDNRLLMSHPLAWQVVLDGFLRTLREQIGQDQVQVVAGTATSGIPHASLIADRLGLPLAYVDFGQSERGMLVGPASQSTRTVLIEDLVTTGGSVLEAAGALRQRGIPVEWCVSIFTYDLQRAERRFAAEHLQYWSLCTLPTLLDVGVRSGRLSPEARREVLAWIADPEAWSNNVQAQAAGARPTA